MTERFQALLSVVESVISCRDPEEVFRGLARELPRAVPFDRLELVVVEPGGRARLIDDASRTGFMEYPIDATYSHWVIETQEPLLVADTAAETRWPGAMAELQEQGIASFCSLPLTSAGRQIGALTFGSREPGGYGDVAFLAEAAKLVAMAVGNALAFRDIAERLKRRPHADEPVTLEAVERTHILRVLGETNWVLGGPRGAAARLGMKRTTLQSLMRRLAITRPRAA